jgi:hypothetical protein
MSRHGAGVAKAKVDISKPVHVVTLGALRLAHKWWEGARPFDHPVHGHATEQRFASTFKQSFRFWPLTHKALLLALHEGLQALAVDDFRRHVYGGRASSPVRNEV